ncbi:sensor histidine kinase [Pseudonocardia asaccharolytica]|uniref:sensor histidine kinase n=1 Tax=Pseudonocardia asaccharolytica TaxID=54010 RepID=UPI0004155582|nr:HAMP domain-containing sensor histidine kinase [Pseudonocardia asaccharolytica]
MPASSHPRGRLVAGVRDLIGVYLIGLAMVGLALLESANGAVGQDDALNLLILGTVGLGSATALLGDVSGRLFGDVRPSWIAAALALYTFAVVPSTTLWPEPLKGAPIVIAARMAAFAVVLVVLLIAVRPPVRLGHWAPWLAAATGVLASIGAAHGAVALPGVFTPLTQPVVLSVVVILAWMVTSTWLVLGGVLRRDPTVWWMSLGLLMVGVAHLYQVGTGVEQTEPDLVFGAIGLVGMLTVLVGTLRLVRGEVDAVRDEQEELRVAAAHMERASARVAERDHELRNGLTGLTGITQLLSAGRGDAEQEHLRFAVLHELSRLAAILEGDQPGGAAHVPDQRGYEITPVLDDVVRLRQAAGARIELDSRPGLRTTGSPDVLTQVIGNLLSNSAQHAPGAAVRVRAAAVGSRIQVEVCDDGPGLTRGQERLVLGRGVRGAASDGHGLGLFVSRELLDSVGGSLRVLGRGGLGGCAVIVELPRVPPPVARRQVLTASGEARGRTGQPPPWTDGPRGTRPSERGSR